MLVCLLAVLRWVSAPLLWTELGALARSQNSVGNRHPLEVRGLEHLMVVLQPVLLQPHVMELGALMQHPSWVGNHSWEVRVLVYPMADLQLGLGQQHAMELVVQVQSRNLVGNYQILDDLKTA